MPLQIMENIYPASWFYLTRHCYGKSMFVKHNFAAVAVCLFVVAVVVVTVFLLLLSLLFLLLLLLFSCFFF